MCQRKLSLSGGWRGLTRPLWLTDVSGTYRFEALAGGERETDTQQLCLTSAPVIWYTTDSPSEYDRTVSRQTARPLAPAACMPTSSTGSSFHIRADCLNLPGAQATTEKERLSVCTSNAFPKYYKTSDSSCFACRFCICYVLELKYFIYNKFNHFSAHFN